MEPLKTIEQEWATFTKFFFKGPIPPVQYREMKLAFFSGASVMLKNCRRIGETDISEADGVQWIEERTQEAMDFCKATIREYSQ